MIALFRRGWLQVSLPLLFAAMLIPLFVLNNWFARDRYYALASIFEVVALLVMGFTAAIHYHRNALDMRTMPALFFLVWALLSVLWSISLVSTLIFVVAFVLYYKAAIAIWRSKTAWGVMPYVIYGGLLLLYLRLGIGQRGIGGIWPIMIGHFCMCAVLFACFSKRLPLLVILIAFALAAKVEARTSLLELGLFVALRYGGIDIFVRVFSKRMIIPALIAACLLVFVGLGVLLDAVLHFFDTALNIHEAVRTSTDLTGRTAFWHDGWNAFALHPIVGNGANTRVELGSNILVETNAHSGLINLMLDLGLIGLFLFVWWLVSAIHYIQDIGGNPRARRVRLSSTAFLIASTPLLVTEPNYIGFYSPGSIALFMCLVLPAAPQAIPLFGKGRPARAVRASGAGPMLDSPAMCRSLSRPYGSEMQRL